MRVTERYEILSDHINPLAPERWMGIYVTFTVISRWDGGWGSLRFDEQPQRFFEEVVAPVSERGGTFSWAKYARKLDDQSGNESGGTQS